MKEVALFPIPNCVAFPGTVFPLHVFEPRYRQMVNYCLDNNVMMGITHTEELISPAKRDQSLEEALNTNQATYKPYTVFSAGKVALQETLQDGRLLINVHLTDRLHAVEETQNLPFMIFQCESYNDHEITIPVLEEANQLKQKILKRLIALTSRSPQVSEMLQSDHWQTMDCVDFSFELFGLVQMSGDIRQQILQCRSPVERLNIALQLMNQTAQQ
ncbi:ATP-dependent protease [Aliikangiella marina]|uniref:ATP-dependent protease n=1 Tax=Aliikangiella marina TaxID=1712262 RepID=A0A545T123_9GAMM|nr:LON peptidase substrate-binding domain-containing protein [Aliikangiella marina]TQV70910.1 ATP-dependent protease [Aliikangiella marina]